MAPRVSAGVNNRLSQKRPLPAPAEAVEDIAVFDAAVRATLPPEVAAQAAAVSESLRLVSESHDDDALERLREISRRSPLSDWRLFVRGLIDWYAGRLEAADESWDRLDRSRRPARIATALQASLHEDLGGSIEPAVTSAAKLVRTLRVERPAIREAAAKLRHDRVVNDVHLSLTTLDWLKSFVNEYRRMEPDFIRAIEAAALQRATAQPYSDLFSEATRAFRGPDHDPHHSLLRYHYESNFEDGDERAERAYQRYVTHDLPACHALSPEVRGAMISRIHLSEAMDNIIPPSPGGMLGALMAFAPQEDRAGVEHRFREAIMAYPPHQEAHQEFVAWLKSHAESEGESKSVRDAFAKKLPAVMQSWSEALPDDIEPRLWLVDHLLENEQLDAARPHVEWLAASRHEDPRVRATSWKWELLEAMRLCRRKSWLSQVPERLDSAESLWPDWLSRDWLPYLRAAHSLRIGDQASYLAQRQAIVEAGAIGGKQASPDDAPRPRGPLTDAVMMLAAAQRMRIPAPELKAIRDPVDQAVAKPGSLSRDDLLAAGAFFWDLHRVSLIYPAYRMHGSKLGRELFDQLRKLRSLPTGDADSALLWMAQHRFWPANDSVQLPGCVRRATTTNVFSAAAVLQSATLAKYGGSELRKLQPELEFVRESAKTVPDRFYRYWLAHLADRAEEARERFFGSASMPNIEQFASMFERFAPTAGDPWDEDEDEEDEDEEEFGSFGWYAGDEDEPFQRQGAFDVDSNRFDQSHGFPTAQAANSQLDPFDESEPRPEPRRRGELPRDPEARRNRPKNPMAKKRKDAK